MISRSVRRISSTARIYSSDALSASAVARTASTTACRAASVTSRASSVAVRAALGVPFRTPATFTSGIRSQEIGEFVMQQLAFPSASPIRAAQAARRASAIDSPWTVNQRLANAERELRVQFIRIAQLQAQLDVVVGALRGSPDGVHV
jgi:hypothetical protein